MGGGISIFGQLSSYTNYILFLDSDDLLDKNALQILISKAIHSSADITACSFQCFGENNTRIIHKEGLLKTSDILKDARYFSFGWGGLIKISFFMSGLKFIDSIHMINDDNFFGLDLFLRANNVYYTSKICVYYRVAYGSISNPKSYHLNGLENLYETYYLNAYHIKRLLEKYPKCSKILIFNIKYNANAFIGISSILKRYEKEKIKEIYKFLNTKYKIFMHFPRIFQYLKAIKHFYKIFLESLRF